VSDQALRAPWPPRLAPVVAVHIAFLVGFRNRVLVMFHWAWSWLTSSAGARLITGASRRPAAGALDRPPTVGSRSRRVLSVALDGGGPTAGAAGAALITDARRRWPRLTTGRGPPRGRTR